MSVSVQNFVYPTEITRFLIGARRSTRHWTKPMSPLRVILIDDDHLVRAVLVEWLRDAGLEVMDFSDPREALGTFGSGHPPHVLITDVDLGSALNGFDVADAAHQLWPAVSVILISGMPAGHTGQKLGPRDRYLQKPFSDGCLLRALDQLTGLTGRT